MRRSLWALVVVCPYRGGRRSPRRSASSRMDLGGRDRGPRSRRRSAQRRAAHRLACGRARRLVDPEHARARRRDGLQRCRAIPEIEPPGRAHRLRASREPSTRDDAPSAVRDQLRLDRAALGAEPIYRIQLEAQATCVGLEAWPTDSLRRIRKGLAAARISAAYGNGTGFEEIYEALDHYCGEKR
jgi:hypothetical protein